MDNQANYEAGSLNPARTWHHPSRWWETVVLLGVFGFLTLVVNRVIWNIDVFWHIAAGRAMIEHGGIPSTDIFSSIDPDREWITFQWGYQVIVYYLDQWGGLGLVRFVHAMLMWLGFFLFWWGCRHRLALGKTVSLILLLLLIVLFSDRIRARPHVFNFLAWTILFPTLMRGPRQLTRRSMMTMMAVVGVWANIHAGGAMLFLVAAATLPFASFFSDYRSPSNSQGTFKRAGAWYAAGLIPALLSPNFITGNVQALVMLQRTEAVIGEWKPSTYFLEIAATPGHLVCGVLPSALLIFWLAITAWVWLSKDTERKAAWPFWRALMTLALIVLSMRSVRFVYIATFALIAMKPVFAILRERLKRPMRVALVGGGALAILLFAIAYQSNISCRFDAQCKATFSEVSQRAFGAEHIDTRRFPVEEADVLEQTDFKGTIFAQASWGGYLLYRLWPNVRVIADGRGNYDPEVAEDLALVYDTRLLGDLRNGPAFEDVYRRYHPDLVLQQHPWPVQTLKGRQQPPNSVLLGYAPNGAARYHYRPHPKNWTPLPIKGKQPTIWLNMQSANSRAYRHRVYTTRGQLPRAINRVH